LYTKKAYQQFAVEGDETSLSIPKSATRNKLVRIKNKLLDIIEAVEDLKKDTLPNQKRLPDIVVNRLWKKRIELSVFEKGIISKEHFDMHGMREKVQAAGKTPWHRHLFDAFNTLKRAAVARREGIIPTTKPERIKHKKLMHSADAVRKRLVLTHNLFLDILKQWNRDKHVSDEELRQLEAEGLDMDILPQHPKSKSDFEYYEADFEPDFE